MTTPDSQRQPTRFAHPTSRRRLLRWTAAGVALAGTALGPAVPSKTAAAGQDADQPGLLGSWLVTINPPAGPPVKTLQTFTPGGGTITTPIVFTASPPPREVTAGHGGWVQTDDGAFVVTVLHLVRDPSGVLVGSNKSVERSTRLGRRGVPWPQSPSTRQQGRSRALARTP